MVYVTIYYFVIKDKPQMRDKLVKKLQSYIAKYKLSKYEKEILDRLEDCYYMKGSKAEDYKEVGNSRLGGIPDLPLNIEWPRDNGEHYIFLAQINLKDIVISNQEWPKEGIIYLFLGDNESCNEVDTKILYCQNEQLAKKGKFPDDYKRMYEDEDYYGDNPHKIEFIQGLSLPTDTNKLMEDINILEEDMDNYDNMRIDWEEAMGTDHKIRGYIDYYTSNPMEVMTEEMKKKEWELLINLGFDKKVRFNFWDAGTLNILIDKQDLANRDFTKIYSYITSF